MRTVVLSLLCLFALSFNAVAQQWSEFSKVVPDDRNAVDLFGETVAISGDFAIITARLQDFDSDGNNMLMDAGAAYIYEKDGNGDWNQLQKLVPSVRDETYEFGHSADIDDDFAIVGTPYDENFENGSPELAGAAYIFERDLNGDWLEAQRIVPTQRHLDGFFGGQVAIHGNYIVVSDVNEDLDEQENNYINHAGAVYIFERDSSGTWTETQKIVASDRSSGDDFGSSVAIDGNYLLIGAKFDQEDETGNNALAYAGSAYLFERNASSGIWTEVQKIINSDRQAYDGFGSSVSLDGDHAAVGSENHDLNVTGNDTLAEAGAVYLFNRNSNGVWMAAQKLVASDRAIGAHFGHAICLSGDYLGATANTESFDENGLNQLLDAGASYVFKRDANGNWNETQKLTNSDRQTGDMFGFGIAMSGRDMLIGAVQEDDDLFGSNTLSGAGSAYFFTLPVLKGVDEKRNIDFSAFPNPTSDIFTIQLNENLTDGFVSIANLLGEVMVEQEMENTSQITLSLDHLTPSLYLVTIQEQGKIIGARKLIVK